jgi:hypothetical protein
MRQITTYEDYQSVIDSGYTLYHSRPGRPQEHVTFASNVPTPGKDMPDEQVRQMIADGMLFTNDRVEGPFNYYGDTCEFCGSEIWSGGTSHTNLCYSCARDHYN